MQKEKFHDRLIRLRRARKLSASEVAEQIGVSASTYRSWEYGRAIQGHEPYLRLSETLEITLGELLDGRSAKHSSLSEKVAQAEKLIGEVRRALLSLN